MIKQHPRVLLILFLFVFLIFHHSDARALTPKQVEIKEKDDLFDLMGSEGCDDKDEECLKRRMIADSHLDYIYTQHHKP
ncbi:hypothetical protein UlMin_005612 [Ulmus minor]